MEEGSLVEPLLRLGLFAGIFGALALGEARVPRRQPRWERRRRWLANLGIAAVDTAVVRLVFPAAAVGAALVAEEQGWGVLRQAGWPALVTLPLAVLALDFAVYLQHVVLHAIPALWRLHQVHHADPDFDVTTGLRFHPLEILLSMLWKIAVVLMLGASAAAVLVFEVLLNATAMFNHSNLRVPLGLDRVLRWVVVTPDMHRVHHSVDRRETNTNFGFNLPWWDRLLGTYRPQPASGHEAMRIGLEPLQDAPPAGLGGLLALPFRMGPGIYPLTGPAPEDAPASEGGSGGARRGHTDPR